ncbi:MAG: amidohydrolase [Gordonia sp. (in: high G+C Gram-positive bacteria)]
MSVTATSISAGIDAAVEQWLPVYKHIHAHPETAFAEHQTTALIAEHLRRLGLHTSTSDQVTGVVASFVNGDGPVIGLRADIDALPLAEETGLDYASTVGAPAPAMHACGHDVHIATLLAAVDLLVTHRDSWSGTIVPIFQPAEEVGSGAQRLVESGIFGAHPTPTAIIGQHTGNAEIGTIRIRAGALHAAADTWRVTVRGPGGHAASPHKTIDLIVVAAAIILRLQTIVAREVPPLSPAVVTVSSIHGGSAGNIIPAEVVFQVNVRTFDPAVQDQISAAIKRIVAAEASAAGLTTPPEVVRVGGFSPTSNDPDLTAKVRVALEAEFGVERVIDAELVTGSEDFGDIGTGLGVPSAFWFYGGGLAATVAGDDPAPNGHSPRFAPDPIGALTTGIRGFLATTLALLASPEP